MAYVSERDPNTVLVSGAPQSPRIENTKVAIATITPGMLLEPYNDSGTFKWDVHGAADDALAGKIFALDQVELNETVDDTYAAGDLVKAYHALPGERVWAIVPSGQNLAVGALVQSNGDGKLKALGSGVAVGFCIDGSGGAVTVDTRVIVEVI